MNIKDIKSEARQKLPINMHQAIVVYTIEYAIFITIIALISVASMLFSAVSTPAAVVIICYGVALGILALAMGGIISYSLVDFYLASYKCTPYNVRRLADTVARNGINKILQLNLIRTALGVLLTALLIVPGVFYLSRTAMANYLLNANPKLKPTTVLSASGKVMSGKLGSYMALQFSMFGWYALGVVTLGIGFIWISPYLNLTKAVYYKRCLQGDKQVYNIPVQPVQAVPYQPQYQQPQGQPKNGYANAQPARPMAQEQPMQEPTRPIHIDPPVPPIATLGDDDVMDMNAAINDFGGEAVGVERDTHEQPAGSDVPEVPLTAASPKRKTKSVTVSGTSTGTATATPDPDDDLAIKERILSTQEVDESHVYEKRVDALYSQSNPRSDEKPHNYMVENGEQHANDFVTMEYQQDADASQPTPTPTAAGDAATDSVMSDEDFAEFIRNFDVPVPSGTEFTPLKQTKTHEPVKIPTDHVTPPTDPTPSRVAPERPTATAQGHGAADRSATTPHGRPMRTAEQIRAEREERLRNLRRK